jgi:polyphosphate glucokinase
MAAKDRSKVRQKQVSAIWPRDVQTLAIDIGGSGVKGSVLDPEGQMRTQRVRLDTPYPCPPQRLLDTIDEVAAQLPKANRVSVGFPGLVREGVVLHVPALSRLEYGGQQDAGLAAKWRGFDLAGGLAAMFGLPTKVVNDADMQGCAVAQAEGFEFVMTLGTGVGTALFQDGRLLPHLELSHGPYLKSSFDLVLGNAGRKKLGNRKWNKLVVDAIAWFDEILSFDTILIGGGNAKKLDEELLNDKAQVVPNSAGITGGVRVWDLAP